MTGTLCQGCGNFVKARTVNKVHYTEAGLLLRSERLYGKPYCADCQSDRGPFEPPEAPLFGMVSKLTFSGVREQHNNKAVAGAVSVLQERMDN